MKRDRKIKRNSTLIRQRPKLKVIVSDNRKGKLIDTLIATRVDELEVGITQ
jgi:DNA invertase Pin-like site-specific DNA recombinase